MWGHNGFNRRSPLEHLVVAKAAIGSLVLLFMASSPPVDAGETWLSYSYDGGFHATGQVAASCQGFARAPPAGVMGLMVENASLETFHYRWNQTTARPANPTPVNITHPGGDASRSTQRIPDGNYELTWSHKQRIRAFPDGWPGPFANRELGAAIMKIEGDGIRAGPATTDAEAEVFVVQHEGDIGSYLGAVPGWHRPVEVFNSTWDASSRIAFFLEGKFALAGSQHSYHGAPAETRTSPNPANPVVSHDQVDVTYDVLRADTVALDRDSTRGWQFFCGPLEYTLTGALTLYNASGKYPGRDGLSSFSGSELTMAGQFLSQEEPRNRPLVGGSSHPVDGRSSGAIESAMLDFQVPLQLEVEHTIALVGGALGLGGIAVIAYFLYSRIERGRALRVPARRLVFEMIRNNPGVQPYKIVETLPVSRATVRHHLRQLEKVGLVAVQDFGKHRHCYEITNLATTAPSLRRHPVVEFLRQTHGPTALKSEAAQSLMEEFGYPRSTAWHRLSMLEREGLVKTRKRGGRLCLQFK